MFREGVLMHTTAKHWINGEWQAIGREFPSINPANGKAIGSYFDGGEAAAQAAVDAAYAAFHNGNWRRDGMARAIALSHLADVFASRLNEVIDTLCLENGKLKAEATYEATYIPRSLRFAAGLAAQIFGRVLDPVPGKQSMCIRQPMGVAGLMIPWNSPGYLTIRALAPAMASGCTSIVKLGSPAAQTAALLASFCAEVPEIPKGAVNFFIESGSEGSRLLVASPKVPVISFTGSTKVGKEIAKAAAANFKRVGLELGGKTPHLVFADANIDGALPVIEKALTTFAGQFCMTGSRLLVERSIVDEVRRRLSDRLEKVKPGPASDPASDIGPLISKSNVTRVNGLVNDAIAAGAKVLVRGGPSTDPALVGGAFYRPTLLEVANSTLPIVQDEVFGPVLTLQSFDTEDEAVNLANDTMYGLSACIWSRDADRPIRISRRLDAGLISVNSWANLQMEFEEGGFKSSGIGRLGGMDCLEDFLEYKQITQDYAPLEEVL
jgi:betaine-aldehyde dehydrogenase